mmetsp:Transcript_94791/g.216898  ORF Transcript_94791/g.216898 Transcript_94791/m.216898 type:complete len:86 (+) Transcript_94791:1175-1432(+)
MGSCSQLSCLVGNSTLTPFRKQRMAFWDVEHIAALLLWTGSGGDSECAQERVCPRLVCVKSRPKSKVYPVIFSILKAEVPVDWSM